jgi:hypothetical protein
LAALRVVEKDVRLAPYPVAYLAGWLAELMVTLRVETSVERKVDKWDKL